MHNFETIFDNLEKNEGKNWIRNRTILLAQLGSYAYGTITPDSDTDYRGICIPPKEYYLGLSNFSEYNNTGGKTYKNTKNDIDIVITHINKFVKEAVKGSPNNIELLFVEKDDFDIINPLGEMLVDARHLFLSKEVKRRFCGFANGQIKEMERSKDESGGYNTKAFMHSVRLLSSTIEILTNGDYETFRPDWNFLLACRNGKYSFEEAKQILAELDEDLKTASEYSDLPDQVDLKQIEDLLIKINEMALYDNSVWGC